VAKGRGATVKRVHKSHDEDRRLVDEEEGKKGGGEAIASCLPPKKGALGKKARHRPSEGQR